MLQVVRPGHATDGLILDAGLADVVLGRKSTPSLELVNTKLSRGTVEEKYKLERKKERKKERALLL